MSKVEEARGTTVALRVLPTITATISQQSCARNLSRSQCPLDRPELLQANLLCIKACALLMRVSCTKLALELKIHQILFWKLAMELIDQTSTQSGQVPGSAVAAARMKHPHDDISPLSGIGTHVTPTKIRKPNGPTYNGVPIQVQSEQQRCVSCKVLCSYTCSHCKTKDGKLVCVHDTRHKTKFWNDHLEACHGHSLDVDVDPTQLIATQITGLWIIDANQ